MKWKMYIIWVILFTLLYINQVNARMSDLDIIHSETKTIQDHEGTVSLTVDWLKRPGELALTVEYFGYLTQEGMVNFYISVNGERREFITLRRETDNRAQKIKLLSFHPTKKIENVNRLMKLPEETLVDSLLFRNVPYYKQFGEMTVEIIFFCHSRWDGDGNKNNDNYRFKFQSPITDFAVDHF